jgi:TonB family protein
MNHGFRIAALVFALPLCAAAQPSPESTPAPATSGATLTCANPSHEAIVTKAVRPAYPMSAWTLGLGYRSVQVLINVDASGDVGGAGIYRTSGNHALDEAAIQAALHSKYTAKRVDCVAVRSAYLFRVDFETAGTPSAADVARAADASWDNPFCAASAVVVSWDAARETYPIGASDTYLLYVTANAHTSYAARITMVGQNAAYEIDVPRTNSARPSGYIVTLPKTLAIDHYFVDGAGVDGASIVDCPSFVRTVRSQPSTKPTAAALATFARLSARLVQTMSPAACGAIYTPLRAAQAFSEPVGHFGDRELNARVEAFVDSNGVVVRTVLRSTSGVEGVDDAAIAEVQNGKFQPATFLCTPVVDSMMVLIKYKP